MINKALLMALIFLFTGAFAYSQTVDQILEKSLKMSGYSEKSEQVVPVKIVGKMSAMGMEFPFTMFQKKPMFRIEQEMMGQKTTAAFDGKEAWMMSPMAGDKPQKLPENMLGQMKSQSNYGENPITALKEDGAKFEKLANEAVDGKDAFKIKITTKDKQEQFLFIDAKSYLPVKTTTKTEMMGQLQDAEIYYKDYRLTGKLQMPYLIEINAGTNKMKVIFDSVEPNAKFDDSIFKMPVSK